MIRISQSKDLAQSWKDLIAAYLNNPKRPDLQADSGSARDGSSTEQR